MRRTSHLQLGHFLAERCLKNASKHHIAAFKFGCIEPDLNPATYIKGSKKARLLHGHNYPNAENCMKRIAKKLEKRGAHGVMYCYALGKLVHYIADSFTYPHNTHFTGSLKAHARYETGLNIAFLRFLSSHDGTRKTPCVHGSVFDFISRRHAEYSNAPRCELTDCEYTVSTALSVVLSLTGLCGADASR